MAQIIVAAAGTTTRPRRRSSAPMTPVVKEIRPSFLGGPDSGRTRNECWAATSTDQMWAYERVEDEGTDWHVTHIPSRYTALQPYRSLAAARRATHSGAMLRQMITECTELADDVRRPEHVREEAEHALERLA